MVVFLMPTYAGGAAPESGRVFAAWIKDMAQDFRVSSTWLKATRFAVFGLGNSDYDDNWCKAARQLARAMGKCGAHQLVPLCKGDDAQDMDGQFRQWRDTLVPAICEVYVTEYGSEATEETTTATDGCGDCGSGGNASSEVSSLRQVKSWEEAEAEQRPAADMKTAVKAAAALARDRAANTVKSGKKHKQAANFKKRADRDKVANRALAEWKESQRKRYEGISAEVQSAWESTSNGSTASLGSLSMGEGADFDLEETEEDRMNDVMYSLDELEERGLDVPDSDAAGAQQARALESKPRSGGGEVDLEDLAGVYAAAQAGAAKAAAPPAQEASTGLVGIEGLEGVQLTSGGGAGATLTMEDPLSKPDMVTTKQFKALSKEGYKSIGSHSAVKLCRWTKHQLRGRGGCYKHSCYGITSYQCMETTPSLACANKCVFCWRHMKNPTGREWRWKLDDPEMIVAQAVAKHVKMIRMMRGVPGVQMDRWRAAHTVKHCALSLVGEPIMYPHIGRFVELLHERGISSFLVTNAQFPEAITNLPPVTQLYVSVDASTKESLKAVDRPLFKDFWERFLESLSALRTKRQRTVYRLTLVKRYNADDVEGYAELVARGSPDFIEIKAVTYSGDSNASDLTIKDVPYHEEVRAFCEAMVKRLRELGEDYGLACEHEHSNLVLLAKRKFYKEEEDTWYTWIDYEKFHELAAKFKATDGAFTFGAEDYMAATPKWAHYNAPEAGFSPNEVRFKRTKGGGYKPVQAGGAGVGAAAVESKAAESKAAV